MAIWALADLHLSFGIPNKEMDFFGDRWIGWTKKVESHWRECIAPEDLILIAGDISWATAVEDAVSDLEWIHRLPGTKVMIKGNHDYWWTSLNKIYKVLPDSIHLIQNNAFNWNHVTIGGSRLWDTAEYGFKNFIEFKDNARAKNISEVAPDLAESERIFSRELERLELSLKAMDKNAEKKIVMTHYPPIGADLQDSKASKLLEKYGVDICVFGHLHNVKQDQPMFGKKNEIFYYLTACDYLNFKPIKISD